METGVAPGWGLWIEFRYLTPDPGFEKERVDRRKDLAQAEELFLRTTAFPKGLKDLNHGLFHVAATGCRDHLEGFGHEVGCFVDRIADTPKAVGGLYPASILAGLVESGQEGKQVFLESSDRGGKEPALRSFDRLE
jgi:hypothetical protein